jgi:hypothetical protein
MLKLVQTKPTCPFDALWRDFPQLKNATCVDRSGSGCAWIYVIRTFRTLEGKYVRITSTEKGNELGGVPLEEVKIYEDVWKRLGHRALGKPHNQPHGIVYASEQFFELTEEIEEFGSAFEAAE